MALQQSTGLRSQLLDTAPFRTIFNLGFLKLYAGSVPANADAAFTGTLLLTVSNNNTGTGLTFAAASSGVITKTLAEVWSGTTIAAGTATYYRLVAVGDTAGLSTTQARLQGLVAQAGAEMNLPTIALLNTTLYAVDNYAFSLPTL